MKTKIKCFKLELGFFISPSSSSSDINVCFKKLTIRTTSEFKYERKICYLSLSNVSLKKFPSENNSFQPYQRSRLKTSLQCFMCWGTDKFQSSKKARENFEFTVERNFSSETSTPINTKDHQVQSQEEILCHLPISIINETNHWI